MSKIENVIEGGKRIIAATKPESVTNTEVGQLFVDAGESIKTMSGLGVRKTYVGYDEMEKDVANPIGDDGLPITNGNLVMCIITVSVQVYETQLYYYVISPDNHRSWKYLSGIGIPVDMARTGGYEGTLQSLDDAKVDKVEGKSLVSDTEIKKLSKLPTREQLDESFESKADNILASDTQNGLLSKEHFIFITDMATHMENLIEKQEAIKNEIKRIADTQDNPFNEIDNKYSEVITVFCNNDNSELVGSFVGIKGQGKQIIATRDYVIDGVEFNNTVTTYVDVFVPSKGLVKVATDTRFTNVAFENASSPIIDFIAVNSKTITSLGIERTSVKGMDLTNASALGVIYARSAKNIKRFDFRCNKNMTTIYAQECAELLTLDLSVNIRLRYVNTNSSSKLNNIILPTTNSDLATLGVAGTALTKDQIVSIGNLWVSRVGKTSGSITISPAIFNSMSETEKAIFTDKNITIVTL